MGHERSAYCVSDVKYSKAHNERVLNILIVLHTSEKTALMRGHPVATSNLRDREEV